MTECAVFDIDGTLCEPASGYKRGSGESWEAGIILNPPKVREPMRLIACALAAKMPILYATARREEIRQPTKLYLDNHGFPFGGLFMRTVGGAPEVVKRRYLSEMRTQGFKPVAWFDDDDAVIAMLRMEGVNALHCGT